MKSHKSISSLKIFKNEKLQRFSIFLITFIVLYIVCILESTYNPYDLKVKKIFIYLGISILIFAIEALVFLYIYYFRRKLFYNNNKLFMISITLIVGSLVSAGTNIISGYLIPVSFVSILIAITFEPMVAFSVSIPFTIIILFIGNFNPFLLIIYIVGCISGIMFTKNVSVRNNILLGGLFVGLINGIIVISFSLIMANNLFDSLINCGMSIGGGMLSSILAVGFLPIFEQAFDIITPIRLLEISNPNQPLLKKMLFESPGTYHHSILVGNLSEAAADEIGANSLLARVGAYYHDIGKIKRPYFFKENQVTNDNPHDKITPKLSAIIITSHVKDGLELADEYKLPKSVKDIIAEHHGTTLVRYFYALAANDDGEEIQESNFRYDSPKPSTKESGIVMLADSIEAAVRSINNPTINDIEKMISYIVKEKIDDGQMDGCDLTMKDIHNIKKSFAKVLGGMFHSRIEYPNANEKVTMEENSND